MVLKKRMRAILPVFLAALLALADEAKAETIGDLVNISMAPPVRVAGMGIVTGLSNTGDKSPGALNLLRKYLSNNGFDIDASGLARGNIALVQVTGEMPPFSRPGTTFPVNITSFSDAASLRGGELVYCDLFDGSDSERDGPIKLMARANGPVVVGTDSLRRGKILAGQNSGALQVGLYDFGRVLNEEGWIRLNLKHPNWADANTIARQINQTPSLNPYLQVATMFADAPPTQVVAKPLDSGQVVVFVPPQYRSALVAYITDILQVPVPVDRPATILVNRSKNSIVVTGDIRVANAVVSLQDKMVTIRPETVDEPARYTLENDAPRNVVELDGPGTYADLQGLIDTLNAMGLTTDQVITVFEQLRSAKAINAILINE